MMLTNFHVSAYCAPTRGMLVGKPGYEGYINGRAAIIAITLRRAGYHAYMISRWHLDNTVIVFMSGNGGEVARLQALYPQFHSQTFNINLSPTWGLSAYGGCRRRIRIRIHLADIRLFRLQTDKINAHAVRLQASAVSAERGQVKSEHVHDRSDVRRDVPVLTYPGLACGTRPREC